MKVVLTADGHLLRAYEDLPLSAGNVAQLASQRLRVYTVDQDEDGFRLVPVFPP